MSSEAHSRARHPAATARERLRVARDLGTGRSAALAWDVLAGRRTLLGLRRELTPTDRHAATRLVVEDARAFDAFRELAEQLDASERLEVLWYARLADEGA